MPIGAAACWVSWRVTPSKAGPIKASVGVGTQRRRWIRQKSGFCLSWPRDPKGEKNKMCKDIVLEWLFIASLVAIATGAGLAWGWGYALMIGGILALVMVLAVCAFPGPVNDDVEGWPL